jgi:hypothetical protein
MTNKMVESSVEEFQIQIQIQIEEIENGLGDTQRLIS